MAQSVGGRAQAGNNTAVISGTVLSEAGAEVQGARVVLKGTHGGGRRVLRTNGRGEFTFSSLPAGTYRITVSGKGWGTYVSAPIHLAAGGFQIATGIVLPLATSTSIRVVGSPNVLAEQQLHIAEQQRVLGVFANFYSNYNWNAPPMHSPQKFQLAVRSLVNPLTFLTAGTVAAIEQYGNRYPGYGAGGEGFLKRFGAAYADAWSNRLFSDAILASILHQDPRYFYRGSGSDGSRALWAVASAVIARGDNGRWEPSYSRIFGSFAAGALSNVYYPAANRGGSLVLTNGLINIAGDAGENLVREFVSKKITSHARAHDH